VGKLIYYTDCPCGGSWVIHIVRATVPPKNNLVYSMTHPSNMPCIVTRQQILTFMVTRTTQL